MNNFTYEVNFKLIDFFLIVPNESKGISCNRDTGVN